MKKLNMLDQLCLKMDRALKSVSEHYSRQPRPYPASRMDEPQLNAKEQRISAGLMRVNHAGEVCAQALYLGQGITARLNTVRRQMNQAAQEEVDHLQWTHRRLKELNSHRSVLNPLWFTGSFLIGAIAGLIGDRWSLGFVAETERQVVKHLDSHMQRLPISDGKSRKIIEQMREEESRHQQEALAAGAAQFPMLVQKIMQFASKIMTTSTYWV